MDRKKMMIIIILSGEKAVPEVLLKVIEAKGLLIRKGQQTCRRQTDSVGISRSSFYKYKDDIFPFHENNRGKTINLMLSMDDVPGLLSSVLNYIARANANILTIHQSIPIGGIASITLGIEILPETMEVSELIQTLQDIEGVHYLKILGRE